MGEEMNWKCNVTGSCVLIAVLTLLCEQALSDTNVSAGSVSDGGVGPVVLPNSVGLQTAPAEPVVTQEAASIKTTEVTPAKNISAPQQPSNDQIFDIIKNEVQKPILEKDEHISIDHARATSQVSLNQDSDGNRKSISSDSFNLSASEYTTQPERFDDIVNQAYEAVQSGHLEAGLVLYKKAQSLDPNNTQLLYAMGTIYQKKGQFEQANTLYKQILLQDPANHKALTNYLSILATTEPATALRELKSLETVNNSFAPVIGQIGVLYAQQKQYNEAIGYFQRAIALAPNELHYLYNLAVIYDQTGENRKARQLYYEIIRRSQANNLRPPISIDKIAARIETLSS